MKYYGIKQAERREDFRYWYAKNVAKLKTIIPGKQKKYWKRDYEFKFQDQSLFRLFDNKIPEDHYVQLFQFTTSDLILREDISQLKHGLNWLLMHQRPGDRFHALPIDTPEDVSRKIDECEFFSSVPLRREFFF